MDILYPEDHPDHHVIGNYFKAHGKNFGPSEVYFCDSYDPQQGYWMTSLSDDTHRTNVSERAISRTYHQVYDHGFSSGILHCQWGKLTDDETALIRAHMETLEAKPASMRI